MSDAQRELHQRSLRNVRALLEREQQEFERQKRNKRLLWWAAIPAAILFGGVVWFGAMNNPATRDAAEKRRMACETDVWASKSREAELAIRAANPSLPPSEIGRILQRDNSKFQDAAAAECKRILGR